MKYLLYCCCFLLLSCGSKAQGTETETQGEDLILEGVLEKRPWTKSTESYCAQGSDYYVLVDDTNSYILEDSMEEPQNWEALEGKRVRIEAVKIEKTIKAASDEQRPMEQRPVTTFPGQEEEEDPGFSCTVWKVEQMNVMED